MTEPSGSPQDERGPSATPPMGSWPSHAEAPPFARPAADAPTEPELERTLESAAAPTVAAFHDLSGPPAPGAAPFDASGGAGAPGYPPPGYGYGYGGTPYGPYACGAWAPPKNNGLAIAAMVCGICGFVLCQLCAIPALILGIRARRQIRESQGAEQGDAFALAGIILGGVGIALLVAIIAFYVVFFGVFVAAGAGA